MPNTTYSGTATGGQQVAAPKKLTATQVKALIDLRDDTRHGFRNAGLGNRTGEALRRQGLVEWMPGRWYGGKYRITDAGRAALEGAL